jgi:hypothetical protein
MENFNLSNSRAFSQISRDIQNPSLKYLNPSLSYSHNFIKLDEFRELKLKRDALEQKIKFRQDFETTFSNLKLNEIEKEIEGLKFKNSIAKRRNEDLINSIQNDLFKCQQVTNISQHSGGILKSEKNRYKNYINYQLQNIRKEFHQKILLKQNQLQEIQKFLKNKFRQEEKENSKMGKENEFVNKISEFNEELENDINFFMLRGMERNKNNKIRSDKIFHQVEEEKNEHNLENVGKIEEEESIENIQNKQLDEIDNQITSSDKNKKDHTDNKEITSISKNERNFNYKKTHVKDISNLEVNSSDSKIYTIAPKKIENLEKSLNPSKKLEDSKLLNNSITSLDISIKKNQPPRKSVSKKPGMLGEIRRKKQELIEKRENVSESKYKQKNYTFQNDETSNQIQKTLQIPSTITLDNPENNIIKEENLINSQKNNSNKSQSDEFIITENQRKFSLDKAENISEGHKHSELETLIQNKPDLRQINKEYKIKVIKKTLNQIEKNSKTIKPNNPSSFIYQTKHINFNTNKENVKNLFYEILGYDNNNYPNEIIDKKLSSTSTDMLIFLTLGILNSNQNFNLDPEHLRQSQYNEQNYENNLDSNIREILEMILTHMKKLVFEKKTSPNVAANILSNSMMNFEKDERMTSNLVAVLERKLTQKSVQTTGSWGGFQFNRKNKI